METNIKKPIVIVPLRIMKIRIFVLLENLMVSSFWLINSTNVILVLILLDDLKFAIHIV